MADEKDVDADDPYWRGIADQLRQNLAKSRGRATYWEWALDRSLAEIQAGRVLQNFLVQSGEFFNGELTRVEKDPPDVLLSTPGGRKIGIEVTELIDEKAMRAFARQKSASSIRDDFGGGPPWVDWSVEKITNGVLKAIAAKDQKLAKVAGDYNELFVAIVTDESGVYEEIARKAASLCNTAVSVVTRAFLILSYHPQADTNLYPDGCVVLPIKLVPRAELGRLGQ